MRTIRPYGPTAFLVEAASTEEVMQLAWLQVPGVVQRIPGAQTLLVECAHASAVAVARDEYATALVADAPVPTGHTLTIDVAYDGADLASVAEQSGLPVDEVIAQHAGAEYRVALCGFAPGFAYLAGLPPVLQLPRRAEPRTRVPAGSVAIAGAWSGMYPRASPGGWHLLGTTAAPLWDTKRNPPALLTPGDHVRFRAV